jgi:hypothetical protein
MVAGGIANNGAHGHTGAHGYTSARVFCDVHAEAQPLDLGD